MSALITLFLAALPELLKAGNTIGTYVQDFRAAAKQRGEWTEEHERAFLAKVAAATNARHWQTDAERGV